jgi:hypothetical protein
MALKPLNSVGGFSVGEVPANVILANADITANKGTFVGNVAISNVNPAYGVLTDNLYYSNGVPWDLQQAAGSNTEIQFNNNNDFGASANFTFNAATNTLTVSGNANVTGVVNAGAFANGTSNLTIPAVNGNVNISAAGAPNVLVVTGTGVNVAGTFNTGIGNANLGNVGATNGLFTANITAANATVNLELQANTANFDGNVVMDNWLTVANTANVGNLRTNNLLYANGVPWDLQEAAGLTTQIQYNNNNNFAASANFTFNDATNKLTLNGNIDLGGSAQNQLVNLSNTALEVRGGWNSATSTAVNIVAGDYSNSTNWGKLAIFGNYSGNAVGFSEANAFVFTNPGYGLGNVVKIDLLNPAATSTSTGVIQANGGIGIAGNGYFGGNLSVAGNIANVNNISVTNNLYAVTANFTGTVNVDVDVNVNNNVYIDNDVNVNVNLSVNNYSNLTYLAVANTANFSANVIMPNLQVNLHLAGNTANFTGNVIAANFTGPLANGNSNINIYSNSNVEISIGGNANIATFVDNRFQVVGNINSTSGNIISNGNVIANGFLVGSNANVTGAANIGSVITSNITSVGNLNINVTGVDQNITLSPTGNGVVFVNQKLISQVKAPVNPDDAATKEYVDNLAQGLSVHDPVRVTSTTNLSAVYTPGGTTQTTTDITGGKTIQFSANHGLSIGDEIYWTSSFNGIVANNSYFVYSIPALNQITIKDGFYGTEVTTLTNGTGLSQPSRANSGVGAILTQTGGNSSITIDGIFLSTNDRVLVQGQTNQFENGVYIVTVPGLVGSQAWELTRSSDEDTYDPKSTTGLGYGDYFFVQQGNSYAGSSYVLTSPVGEIVFGVTNIIFSQFSAAGSYTAGNGINITGTTISANVDNITTAIVSGNIVVKSGAVLSNPNITDATFNSLTWNNAGNGNVTANNLSIGNIANITLDLTVGGNIQANGTISSNANVSGLNITTNGNVQAGGNVLANNVNANTLITVPTANVSNIVNAGNVTITSILSGNTANFSGNINANANMYVDIDLEVNNNVQVNNNVYIDVDLEVNNNVQINNNIDVDNNLFVNNYSNLTLLNVSNVANFSANVVMPNVTVNTTANIGNLYVNSNVTSNLLPNANLTLNIGSSTQRWKDAYVGNIDASGNLIINGNTTSNNFTANIITANTKVVVGNTAINWGTVTTTSITANQTISSVSVTGITGVQWLVKGLDAGGKHSVATVQAVTDGSLVDWATFGGVQLGGTTGTLAVNISGGNILLQVTPASSNSTVWVTQYRTI